MSTFNLSQIREVMAKSRSSYLGWVDGTFRHDSFFHTIPKVSMATESTLVYNVEQIGQGTPGSEANFMAFLGEGEPPIEIKAYFFKEQQGGGSGEIEATEFRTGQFIIEVTFNARTLRSLSTERLETLIAFLMREAKHLSTAAIIYGQTTWDNGWPYSIKIEGATDFARMYDISGANAPKGLATLLNEGNAVANNDVTFAGGNELFSLSRFTEALHRSCVLPTPNTYLVMNSDMFFTLFHALQEAGLSLTEREDPLTKSVLPHYCRMPILLSNFVASYDDVALSGVVNHPELSTSGDTNVKGFSSVFAVQMFPEDPLRGFCLLHPEDEEKGFVKMKRLPPSQNNEEVTYRVSSEFSLHVAADFNVARIKGIGMPFRPRLTTFRTAFDGF